MTRGAKEACIPYTIISKTDDDRNGLLGAGWSLYLFKSEGHFRRRFGVNLVSSIAEAHIINRGSLGLH